MFIRTVDIPNIYVKFWTHKRELSQGNYLSFLIQTSITRQIPFKLTDIDYDKIKDEIDCSYGLTKTVDQQ